MKKMTLCPTVLALGLVVAIAAPAIAQQAGENINVLPVVPQLFPGDPDWDPDWDLGQPDPEWFIKGDGFLQRQLEPTIAASTRNPDHLIAFFNDYRTVDAAEGDIGLGEETQTLAVVTKAASLLLAGLIHLPDIPFIEAPPTAAAEAWVGCSRSYDGGLTWSGCFMPGALFDNSPASLAAPIKGLEAATDPVAVAGPCGYVYVSFVAFTRGGQSNMVVSRWQDTNDEDGGDTWEYQNMTVVETGNNAEWGYFLDKPHINLDVFRDAADFSTHGPNFEAEECGHRVYTSYSTFNGLSKEGKIQTKVNFGISTDAGETFTTQKINKNWGQNQGSFIAVDPRPGWPGRTGGPGSVYVFWRHFFDPDTIVMTRTTDYGVKWSSPVSILGSVPMAPFDQPTIATTTVLNPVTLQPDPVNDLTFRSNGFPTAVVTGNGTVFAAWQERVDIAPNSSTFGEPRQFYPEDSPPSSPRIVLTRSDDAGSTWTGPWVDSDPSGNGDFWPVRRAVDFGDRDGLGAPVPPPGFGALPDSRPSGPQVMPWLSFGGDRLALAYYESRGLLGGFTGTEIQPMDISPSTSYISGIKRLVDFRAAMLDPATGELLGTTQISRYPISASAILADGEDVVDIAPVLPTECVGGTGSGSGACQPSLNFMNKPQSGSGTSPFMGDYTGMTPIVTFIYDYDEDTAEWAWRWAIDPTDVPYRAFHTVFADNRHLVPPDDLGPTGTHEWEGYQYYSAPDSGTLSCINAGSRNTDVLTSRLDAELIVSAPTTYRAFSERRGFPVSVFNRSNETRFYRLTILSDDPYNLVTFSADENVDVDPDVVEIFAYSSVSLVVYVRPPDEDSTPIGQIVIEIQQVEWNENEEEWDPVEDGEQGFVTLNPDPSNLGGEGGEAQNPFVVNEGVTNPFVVNPFVVNPFVVNPFVVNPFVVNPFVVNTALDDDTEVFDVVDNTWSITADEFSTASSYLPVINIDNAEQFLGNYAFQLLIYKASSHGSFDECTPYNVSQAQILSNVSQHPDAENPFVVNPFVVNPFVVNPFVVNPFVVNSTFTVAPSETPEETTFAKGLVIADDGTLRAPKVPDKVYVTLRAFQLVPDEELGEFVYQPDVDEPAFTSVALPCDPDEDPDCIVYLAPDLRLELTESDIEPGTFVPTLSEIPDPILAGLPFSIDWNLENIGNVPAEAENRNLRHGFYISSNETVVLGPDDQPTDGDRLVGSVPSGFNILPEGGIEEFGGVQLLVPYDADPDYFKYLVLFVDDYREISEVNEPNNQYAMEITIEPPPPDEFFDGFFNPWTADPAYTVNAGSAIPLKWRYVNPDKSVVDSSDFAPAVLAKRLDSCEPLDPLAPGETIAITELPYDPGSSSLRYSPSSGTWQINWETDPGAPGCYYLRVVNQTTGISDPLLIKLE